VKFDASQPNIVGLVFRPRLMNVFTSGMDGNAVPFSMVSFKERW